MNEGLLDNKAKWAEDGVSQGSDKLEKLSDDAQKTMLAAASTVVKDVGREKVKLFFQ